MSLVATIFAWKTKGIRPSHKLVLLALADRADETHTCYPAVKRLESDTGLNRKTIFEALNELESRSIISRIGYKNNTNLYKINLAEPKLDSTENGTTDNLSSTENGTTEAQESTENGTTQHQPETPGSTENGTSGSTENGILISQLTPQLLLFKKNKKIKQKKQKDFLPDDFLKWYEKYPRKVGRKAAISAWSKITDTDTERIIGALDEQIAWRSRMRNAGGFVAQWPNPATWLNGERWTDELDETGEIEHGKFNMHEKYSKQLDDAARGFDEIEF